MAEAATTPALRQVRTDTDPRQSVQAWHTMTTTPALLQFETVALHEDPGRCLETPMRKA
ncbi:hypothetical protein SPHINGOT1_230043 [Sphingomonas sp. T1]|nr:hypothetical protein SPHINGOT1_230043 [Sphingomonas sp. T1]